LRNTEVPQDPAWIAHVDCDALRNNSLGKFLLAEMNKPENEPKIAAATLILGVDLRTQIHALTFYAPAESSKEPILLLYGEFDTNRLATLAKSAREYDSAEYNGHVIHSWRDEKRKTPQGGHARVYAALPNSGLIIFGPRQEAVSRALDVLDNKAANLSNSKTYPDLLKSSDQGAFVQAAARKLDLPHDAANLTTYARMQVQENDQQVTASMSLGGRDEEVAKNMLSVAQGITGLIKLQQERPQAAKLAEKVDLKQDGADLLLTFALPSDQVIDFLKAAAARKPGHL
jgi:hypothetical protein